MVKLDLTVFDTESLKASPLVSPSKKVRLKNVTKTRCIVVKKYLLHSFDRLEHVGVHPTT